MLAINSWIILLICTTLCISAEQCSIKILGEYQIIEEMISTQGYFCSMPVKILNKEHVEEKCDRWALVYELEGLLEKLNFTRGTDNYNKKNHLIQTYISCIENEDYSIKDAANAYLQTVNMNAIEILQRINHSLHELDGFKAEAGSSSDCELYYNKQRQSNGVSTKKQFEDGRKKEDSQSNLQLIIIVLLVVFVLLFLSGFLYYRHQYRELERRLNTRCNLDLTENPIAVLPEERERLSITACDIV
ncbi:uncharacterized protein RB166_001930 isoform 2-T2 [Leptodactylus fuscus]|uniref:uncharacterized protein LOC142194873 isoform X2 n=1 Tax=Leptodactylus fuscus TaxID=238119 RepID=UPI003F4EC392